MTAEVESRMRRETREVPVSQATSGTGTERRDRPPPLEPVLQVGLIGHRSLNAAATAALRSTVQAVLAEIRRAALAAVARGGSTERLRLRVVCGLAEGADLLMTEEALGLGFSLAAPLPFAREVYATDFTTPAAREGFEQVLARAEAIYELDGKRTGSEAYEALGRVLLEQSDMVVAIWNGAPERGPGGTGQVLHEAWLADIPTVIVGSEPPHEVRCFDPQAGEEVSGVEPIVARMLAYEPRAGAKDDLAIYSAEVLPPRATTPAALAEPLTGEHDGGAAAVAAAIARVDAVLAPHFEVADRLAMRYGKLYRLSGTLRYLISLPMTCGALLAFYGPPSLTRLGFLIQFLMTGVMLAIYALDRNRQWHRRFLDYRFLAEHLRASRIMALLGSTVALPRLPSRRAGTATDWVAFRLRGTIRALGLLEVRTDPAFLAAVRQVVLGEIVGQLGFYEKRATRYRSLATWLQRIALSFYVVGLGFTLIRYGMAVADYGGSAYDLTAELALVFPSLGPIFFGLRSQAEYNRLSQRYASMAAELHRMRDALTADDVRRNRVERLARELVHVLLAEVSDWRVLIKARDLAPF